MANTSDTAPTPPGKKSARRRGAAADAAPARSGRFAAGLALVFAVIALLASGYVGWLVNSKRGLSDAKGRLVQVEQETAQLQELSAQMGKELGTLRETQGTLTTSLEALHGEIGKGRRAWLVAETENLLVIAQDRLQYARDARLALEALRAADRQLKQLGDPDYLPATRQLASEIARLEDFERLDVAGMARQLGLLAGNVDQLTLVPEPRPTPAAAATGDQGFLREVWQDLQGLVRVRSTADIRRPLLLPDQKYFLRENLRLMLYGAQVALLHGDLTTFEQNTRAARQWLHSYYDATAQPVQAAVAALDGMLTARPATLPDIGTALSTLREIRARQGGA